MISDARTLLKRKSAAKATWEQWRSLLQEAYEYTMPQKETFNLYSPGQRKSRHIYDSTAVLGVRQFSSRMQAAVTPPWQHWVDFVAGTDVPPEEEGRVNNALEMVKEVFFAHMNESDFSNQINESNQDLSVGTGAIFFEEGDESKGEPLFKFTAIPLSSLYLEKASGGCIDTFFWEKEFEARALRGAFPDADLTEDLVKMIEKKPESKVAIVQGIIKSDPIYYHVAIYEKKNHILFKQEFDESPGIVYRWSVTPGETYGRGPVLDVLADVKTLNKVKEFLLKNAAIQMSGVYTAVSDGTFNPYTVQIAPGSIIPVSSNSNQNPSLQRLPDSGRFDVSQLVIQELQDSINKALFSSPMGDIGDPVRTATEQMLRMQEALKMNGASFGRYKTELVQRIVRRGLDILRRNGRIPDIKVDGREVAIRMQSPLAKAEAMEDFTNFQIWFSQLSQLPPEIQAMGARLENIPTWTAEKLGLPTSELARSAEEIQQAQMAVMAMAQQQGMLEEGGGGA